MRQLTLQATRLERGMFKGAYDELSTELAESGWTIIEPRADYEQRDAGRGPFWDGISLAIHLSEEVGHDALGVIVGLVMAKVGHLWKGRGRGGSNVRQSSMGQMGASSVGSP